MKYNKIRPTITASKICTVVKCEIRSVHCVQLVLISVSLFQLNCAILSPRCRNGKSHLRQPKKRKRQHFQQGHSMTLAAASVIILTLISKYMHVRYKVSKLWNKRTSSVLQSFTSSRRPGRLGKNSGVHYLNRTVL